MSEISSIQSLVLTKGENGDSYDISDLLIEFTLYEDIKSNTLEGSIILSENTGLLEMLPISGNEFITCSWQHNQSARLITVELEIFSLYNVETVGNNKYFHLGLTSGSTIIDKNTIIDRVVSGSTSDIIKEMAEILDIPSLEVRDTWDEADENHDFVEFVAPKMTPFEVINYVASRYVSYISPMASEGFPDNSFVFYQTNRISVFGNIHGLKKWVPKLELTYKNNSEKLISSPTHIKKISVGEVFNLKKDLSYGLYGNTVTSHDIINKTVNTTSINYSEVYDSKSAKTIGLMNNNPLRVRENYSSDAKHSVFSSNYLNEDINVRKNNRVVQLQEMEHYKMLFELSGNSFLEVGDIVLVNVPSVNQANYSSNDKQLAGNYMVTKIKHVLSHTNYNMILEVSKESTNDRK